MAAFTAVISEPSRAGYLPPEVVCTNCELPLKTLPACVTLALSLASLNDPVRLPASR